MPITNMTRGRVTREGKTLTLTVADGDATLATFHTQAPRVTKARKVGWPISQKVFVPVDGVPVAFQLTGNLYAIRSDTWGD